LRRLLGKSLHPTALGDLAAPNAPRRKHPRPDSKNQRDSWFGITPHHSHRRAATPTTNPFIPSSSVNTTSTKQTSRPAHAAPTPIGCSVVKERVGSRRAERSMNQAKPAIIAGLFVPSTRLHKKSCQE